MEGRKAKKLKDLSMDTKRKRTILKMDKVAVGRQGELFVIQTLTDIGWKLYSQKDLSMEGLDWVFKKEGRIIKVQVKTGNHMKFSCQGKKTFDYLVFTDLNSIYPIPVEIIGNTNRIGPTYLKLKNHLEILEKTKKELLSSLNDYGIRFWELDTVSPFFK